jgi:membrane protease YdiL (CAAX protease family)
MMADDQPPFTWPDSSSEPRRGAPFWGYHDLFLFVGLAIAGILASSLLARVVVAVLHLRRPVGALEPLIAQLLLDLFVFLALGAIFRLQYDEPFWRSLGWAPLRISPVRIVVLGFATALGVAFAAVAIHLPAGENPMTRLLEDRTSVLLMAGFGVTLGPLFEELVFRGFLQPLVVRSLGAVPGILVAAVPFGVLHFWEYGKSWRHALLISAAGAAFGWMRQATGSTRASTLMHASYNALNFIALFAQKENLPQTW